MKRFPLLLALLFGGFLLIAADGCSSDPNVEGAKLDLKNKDYDRAMENIGKALESNPENAEALELKGQILQEQAFAVQDVDQHSAMLGEMIDAYRRSIDLDPARSANVENQLKLAYYNELQRGIQSFNRGQSAGDSEKQTIYSNSALYFSNAAKIFPDSTGAYINQAFAYYNGGMAEKAIDPLELALEKGDTSRDVFTQLAKIYGWSAQTASDSVEAIHHYKKMVRHLEKGLEVYPEDEEIMSMLLNGYPLAGEEEQAIQHYESQLEKEPNNKLFRYNYGTLLINLKNFDGAIEQLSVAVELDPEYASAQHNLGAAYVNKAVLVNEQKTALDDELSEKKVELSEDQVKERQRKIDALIENLRNLFASAIGPLEKAKMLAEAEGTELKGICLALLQSYAQTNQNDKAQAVSECAGYDVN